MTRTMRRRGSVWARTADLESSCARLCVGAHLTFVALFLSISAFSDGMDHL